ncbi:MAG TPA: tail fiber domain-containing protein [Chitinophagaceae bacterium]|mgnify:CR=1 FL=1|nr:tail fiber domain-containing protein [Chitinophagaceae bacterium]
MKKTKFWMPILLTVLAVNYQQPVFAQWGTFEGIRVDRNGIANGQHSSSFSLPGITFGNASSNSGEGIGSKRNSGTYQNGLDFFTNYIRRVNITNNGLVNVGAVNVGFPNFDANLEVQTSSSSNTAFRVFPIFGDFTKSISITKTGPGALGTNAGISFQGGTLLSNRFELRATTNGIEIADYGTPSGNVLTSKFKFDNTFGMILETPTVLLKNFMNGIGTSKYLTTDATGRIITATLPSGSGTTYTAGNGISIASGVITNTSPSKWVASGANIYNGNSGNVGVGTNAPTARLHTITSNQLTGFTSENNLANSAAMAIYGKANTTAGQGIAGAFEGSNSGVYAAAETDLDQLQPSQAGSPIYDLKGVEAYANDYGTVDSRTTYGVKSQAFTSSANATAIGVYGYAVNSANSSNDYAMYADGDIITTGVPTGFSDARLKTDVNSISNALDIVNQLDAKTYHYRKDGRFATTHLPKVKSYGFIAQDLEKVIPEAVKEAPLFFHDKDKRNNSSENYKSVNYIALIPILSQAIKEQQQMIEELKTMVNALSSNDVMKATQDIQRDRVNPGVTLSQNVPNPFSVNTKISYSIPSSFQSAKLGVYDLNGHELKLIDLKTASGEVIIEGGHLQAGMYLYSLIVDGKTLATKKMTLTSH